MESDSAGLRKALEEWRSFLGEDGVLGAEAANRKYSPSTTGVSRRIGAALLPRSVDHVVSLVEVAGRHGVPLYPFSTGHNWGYGEANPIVEGCVLVDLSGMDQILALDAELGLVTVQPGVTQAKLRAYLDRHAPHFLVPVTGGGPECSILGNALERGYGITPYTDHFAAMTAVQAVLPSGEIYRSPLREMGGETADRAFKWKVGPYLDGLFAQGNFGIVTEMTIRLARHPERVEAFFFGFNEDRDLEAAATAVREVLQTVGGNISGINLLNPQRMLSMAVPFPRERTPAGRNIPLEVVSDLARGNRLQAWSGVGAIYGKRSVVGAVRKEIKKILGPHADRLLFVRRETIGWARRALPFLPPKLRGQISALVTTLGSAMEIFHGVPNEVAMPLAYWKSGVEMPRGDAPIDPARDGCGLIWYSPLIPMKADLVRAYVEMVKRVCIAHGIDPLITLTSVTDGCFDSSVPILFNRQDADETARAHACYKALFDEGKKAGLPPYRAGVMSMGWIVDPSVPFWRLAEQLKRAADPKNILAPGRYNIPGTEERP